MNNIKNISILAATLLLTIAPVMAQPGGSPLGGGPAPIDGGLGILLAAGAGYGIKKIKDAKKSAK